MPIIDTHCHYNLEPLYSGDPFCLKVKEDSQILQMNWKDHWRNAQEKGVNKSIIVGPGLASSLKAIEIANTDNNLYAAVGIHPERANKIIDVEKAVLELKKLANNKSVVAIGEAGLDYFYLKTEDLNKIIEIKKRQKDLFISQIKLAQELNLPLILHVRDREELAYNETLDLIEKYWQFSNSLIFHCVSGPLDYIKRALSFKKSYFGFGGNITFKKADEIRKIFTLVKETDPSKILLETDSPYLAPEPYRGQICEPQMIAETANYLENELGANLEKIYQNSISAFSIH
ncbi:TatD family hydrolase [Patescibacteria group bacterium]|nr:TatD family hydrolase [Patescibacteria group bacterium]